VASAVMWALLGNGGKESRGRPAAFVGLAGRTSGWRKNSHSNISGRLDGIAPSWSFISQKAFPEADTFMPLHLEAIDSGAMIAL
jgi:hypothetical protein